MMRIAMTTSLQRQPVNSPDVITKTAKQILAIMMRYRRVPHAGSQCANSHCETCSAIHLPKILKAVSKQQPIQFVLPAFPGKSPNPEKVLGYLPDFAEQFALQFLGLLCEEVKKLYSPGIKIIICSDGRVFSDVVGMHEMNVSLYQNALNQLLDELNLTDVSTFNMDQHYSRLDYQKMREALMQRYAQPLSALKEKIKNGSSEDAENEEIEANRMYRGITRFLFEDAMHAGQKKSRTAVQKDARARAYEVIRRSNAWSELISDRFPDAVRLSIHPQTCGSKKLGIRLVANESWMTPWHGVAVNTQNGVVLMRRKKAEMLGARLQFAADGAPSHFQLIKEE